KSKPAKYLKKIRQRAKKWRLPENRKNLILLIVLGLRYYKNDQEMIFWQKIKHAKISTKSVNSFLRYRATSKQKNGDHSLGAALLNGPNQVLIL
ncbi:MAG: hypothetical protein CMA66_03300, partial [Euryarchaeota archaeon]|nr:hypothetical protein [Euryarchaeota archaeon]